MPNRLNVIMVQGSPPTATAQRVAEAVVGELIGRAGMDLSLVDRLDQIQLTSTDLLTLKSLSGDVAVLDWQPAEATAQILHQLGIEGSRARHEHDLEAAYQEHSRRLYLFDLREFDHAQLVIEALGQLLSSRQVRTFSLDGLLPPGLNQRAAAEQPISESGRNEHAESSAQPNLPNQAKSPDQAPAPAAAPTQSASPSQPGPKKALDLDELVEQLDSLDLH